MFKPTVYIETSIISYLVARPHRNPLVKFRQTMTRRWWDEHLPHCSPFVSAAVEQEIRAGDPAIAAQRIGAVIMFPSLPLDDTITKLIGAILLRKLVPEKSLTDAAHLAFATVHGLDFLLTWNYRHLANPKVIPRVRSLCREFSCRLPEICTPEQFFSSR